MLYAAIVAPTTEVDDVKSMELMVPLEMPVSCERHCMYLTPDLVNVKLKSIGATEFGRVIEFLRPKLKTVSHTVYVIVFGVEINIFWFLPLI